MLFDKFQDKFRQVQFKRVSLSPTLYLAGRGYLVIARRLQLRAKRGRCEADAAIQNTKLLDCFTSFAMTAF